MSKTLASGSIGKVGSYSVSHETTGFLVASLSLSHVLGNVSVSAALDEKVVLKALLRPALEKAKAAIPGSLDDALIDKIEEFLGILDAQPALAAPDAG